MSNKNGFQNEFNGIKIKKLVVVNELLYQYGNGTIHVFIIPELGGKWFIAKEILPKLGYDSNNVTKILFKYKEKFPPFSKFILKKNNIEEIDNDVISIPARGLTIINDKIMNLLIVNSKKPSVREYRDWLFKVIDRVQETGCYYDNKGNAAKLFGVMLEANLENQNNIESGLGIDMTSYDGTTDLQPLNIFTMYDIMDISFFTVTGFRIGDIMDIRSDIPDSDVIKANMRRYTNNKMFDAVMMNVNSFAFMYTNRILDIDSYKLVLFATYQGYYIYRPTNEAIDYNRRFFNSYGQCSPNCGLNYNNPIIYNDNRTCNNIYNNNYNDFPNDKTIN